MKRFAARTGSSRGFTLVEVILSIFLLFIVFIAFAAMNQTVRFTNRGRFDDIGRSIAIEHLEMYRATGFNALPDGVVEIEDPGLELLPQGSAAASFSDYGSTDSGLVEVVVTVNWIDKGVPRDVSLTTLLTNGGVGK